MSDSTHGAHRLVFTLGDSLIRSGASSATTTKALLAVAQKSGLSGVTVSVTLGQLVVSDHMVDDDQPRTRIHEVQPGALDIRRRVRAEEVVERFLVEDLAVEDALAALDEESGDRPASIPGRGRSLDWWAVVLGYAILGAGFALVLGGGPPTAVGGAVTSVMISLIFHWFGRFGVPGIYSQAAGGFVAVCASAGINSALGQDETAICIVAAIAARLAGIASYSAVQDAITGWYLSAAGRLLEVGTNTAGLVAGVAVGIRTVTTFWSPSQDLIASVEPDTTHWGVAVLGAAMVSGGFALSSGAWALRLLCLTCLGAAVQLLNLGVGALGADSYLGVALTAAIAGSVCVLVARPLYLSSNAIMMVSLLPLFPGMLVYQGLLGTLFTVDGATEALLAAAVTAFALSVAGVLGQYVVSEMLWAARRRQFERWNPGEHFSKVRPGEYSSRDIMLPIFNTPFNGTENSANRNR